MIKFSRTEYQYGDFFYLEIEKKEKDLWLRIRGKSLERESVIKPSTSPTNICGLGDISLLQGFLL
jgi:hypothetical protein